MPDRKGASGGASDQGDAGLGRRLLAEVFGTMALVFVAVGGDAAGLITGGEVGVAARAVAPALMVAAMIYAIGDVSGAHFNPVVTAAFALKRLFPANLVPLYWIAQTAGGIVGALLVRGLLGDAVGAGVSTPHVSTGSALGFEVLLTLLLVSVILGTADRHRIVGTEAALAVGATIALCGLIALPLEGASMNPARSLGPAIVTGRFDDLWIYVAGPFVGAAVAVGVNALMHGSSDRDPEARRAAQGDP
jgi:MIP family channel proteins